MTSVFYEAPDTIHSSERDVIDAWISELQDDPVIAEHVGMSVDKRLYGLPGTYACYLLAPESLKALRAWAADQDLTLVDEPHVTTVYSRVPVPAYRPADYPFTAKPTGIRLLGEDNALVLTFDDIPDNPAFSGITQFWWRHREAESLGATWDFPEYIPHLTVVEKFPPGIKLPQLPPFALEFKGEVVRELREEGEGDTVDKSADDVGFLLNTNFVKRDDDRRLVAGWASVVHDGTSPIVDKQGDVIDVEDLRDALHDFAKVRVGKAMHEGDQVAELVEMAIVDDDLRKALGAPPGPVGAWVVYKVIDDKTWERVKSGELGAFSIGGRGKRTPL